jgi:hypothetical protein
MYGQDPCGSPSMAGLFGIKNVPRKPIYPPAEMRLDANANLQWRYERPVTRFAFAAGQANGTIAKQPGVP